MNNKNIWLIVIAIVLIGGGFAAYTFSNRSAPPGQTATSTPTDNQTIPGWGREDDVRGYSIGFPSDFDANEEHVAQGEDWRVNANGNPGSLLFTLAVPKEFEPQTNFSEAKLTVGMSTSTKAVADCLAQDPTGGPGVGPTTKSINGITFSVFSFSDAGAGNLYDTVSYRTVKGKACWAVEYTIHSTQLANYPAELHLTQFDEGKVKDILDRVVGTFVFR